MKVITLFIAIIITLAACQRKVENQTKSNTIMETQTQNAAIEKLLFEYRDALNSSDVNKVLPLYTETGVFMPSNGPTAVGKEKVKGAYEFVFSNIKLNIEFFIDEIEVVNEDYAFARTVSRGTTLIHATGETPPEENRELFVLEKEDGKWKIARYMFNKMK